MPQIRKRKAYPARDSAQQPVGGSGYGVLFMTARGQPPGKGGKYGGEGRVTAKPHDHIGPPSADQLPGLNNASDHGSCGGQRLYPPPEHTAHGESVKFKPGPGGEFGFRAIETAHEQNFRFGQTFFQRFGHGQSRENVPARAAGGKDDAQGHDSLPRRA